MFDGFLLGRVRGIEIRANWSVLVVVAIVTWSLADQVLPEAIDGYRTGEYWLAAAVLAVAFLAGLVAHELGHSLVAAREGVTVTSITIWLFGGVAQLASSPRDPRAAMRIAGAGPAVSGALGVLAVAVSLAFTGLIGGAIAWYGAINLLLALFNLLPAFPMDGGRLYQAWLWARSGDEAQATVRAAALGRTIGGALVVLGILEAVVAGAIGGLWLMLIGWFVREAARAEAQRALLDTPLRTVPVTEVMTPDPRVATGTMTIEQFVDLAAAAGRHAAYPVIDRDGAVGGLITLRQVSGLGRDRWSTTSVGDLATPLAEVLVVAPGAVVTDLLEVMQTNGEGRALVMDGSRLVGIVAPSDVARLVTVLQLRGPVAAQR
ncbi:MAG: CBS domain-containing protein [Actinobacteria bacterium]|nr:CBS domain-containing protein [Actinomycetota bacterium]NIW31291.1 CBS domain-containing protein [Actinomycetota bacterium]